MKLDPLQFGWIQNMAGGALGGVATGHSSSSVYEAVASGMLVSIPTSSAYKYEYNLTEFPGKEELEMIVYRTSVVLLKSNVKLEIGRTKISRILFMQSSAKQEFCQKYMDEVVKNYEAKPDKIADLLPTPEISEDVMASQGVLQNFYSQQFLANLKAQMPYVGPALQGVVAGNSVTISKVSKPVELPDDPNDGFSGAGDEQKFLQRIGMMSNLNVDLQGKTIAYKTKEYRLKCSKCGQFTTLARNVAERFLYEDPALVGFCKAHRHVVEISEDVAGRKFRA